MKKINKNQSPRQILLCWNLGDYYPGSMGLFISILCSLLIIMVLFLYPIFNKSTFTGQIYMAYSAILLFVIILHISIIIIIVKIFQLYKYYLLRIPYKFINADIVKKSILLLYENKYMKINRKIKIPYLIKRNSDIYQLENGIILSYPNRIHFPYICIGPASITNSDKIKDVAYKILNKLKEIL